MKVGSRTSPRSGFTSASSRERASTQASWTFATSRCRSSIKRPCRRCPAAPPIPDPAVRRWTEAIAASDAFIFASPEYNYGPPAVLKNAMDWVYPEWNRKPAAFCSWGSVSGARAVQQLRLIALELQLHPIRQSLHVPLPLLMEHFHGAPMGPGWAELEAPATAMFDELLWWTETLSPRRSAR